MNETIVTLVGNLTADPELRYTQNGLAVANFTIAATPRIFDRQANEWKDGEALFMRCSAWRELGEHISHSLAKGARVIAQGRLKQRSFETQQGEKRTVVECDVDEIGPSLRYATAQVTRTQGGGGQQRGPQAQGGAWGGQAAPQPQGGEWGAQPGAQAGTDDWGAQGGPAHVYDDETPF